MDCSTQCPRSVRTEITKNTLLHTPKILQARVRIHNQNMTTAANAHADRKTFGHLS